MALEHANTDLRKEFKNIMFKILTFKELKIGEHSTIEPLNVRGIANINVQCSRTCSLAPGTGTFKIYLSKYKFSESWPVDNEIDTKIREKRDTE